MVDIMEETCGCNKQRIGMVSYKLKLLEGTEIHKVLYVSQLKRAKGIHEAEPNSPMDQSLS